MREETATTRTSTGDLPAISVVIPMRNEAAHIGGCLASLAAQDYPQDRFEVIVADGDSDDGSAGIVREWSGRQQNIQLCANPRRATPFGLNAGIRAALGDVILILGAHAEVPPEFLRENARALEASSAEVVGGVLEALGEGWFGEAVAAAVSSRFGVGRIAFRQASEEGFVDTVAYAAYRREAFERWGLFDEELVRDQDDELNYRIRKHGGRIFLTPRIRTRYVTRASPAALWRQYFDYGFWKVRVLQKHPGTLQPRHFVPAASVLAGTSLLLASAFDARALWLAGPLAIAYLLAVAGSSMTIARRLGWRSLPALVAAFPILHFAYGIGSLLGFIRFFTRWWTPEPPPPPLPPRGS